MAGPHSEFAFVSVEGHIPGTDAGIAQGEVEAVYLVGHSDKGGWYSGTIGAGGAQYGVDALNYSWFKGTEKIGSEVTPISLKEGNIGEKVFGKGWGLGTGIYSSPSPCNGTPLGGNYVHVSFEAFGKDWAIGIGSGG